MTSPSRPSTMVCDPSSRAEAEQVGGWARALGFEHHLLTWTGEKPATRIQERAREARYGLLTDCARAIGASAVVTAHHADDQAETILFRLTRGSGVTGLSGMAPVARLGALTLLRPLLDLRKSALVGVCHAAGHPFFSDPSNADRSLRPRANCASCCRRSTNWGSTRMRSCASAPGRRGRTPRSTPAPGISARGPVREAGPQLASFDADALREAPLELFQRVVAAEIARLAPDAQIRLDRLERAVARLAEALQSRKALRLTLCGLILEFDG